MSCGKFSPVKISMPPKGKKVKFENFHKSMHVPIVVYADSEAILKPTSICRKYTEKYQEHLPSGFCFRLVSPYEK